MCCWLGAALQGGQTYQKAVGRDECLELLPSNTFAHVTKQKQLDTYLNNDFDQYVYKYIKMVSVFYELNPFQTQNSLRAVRDVDSCDKQFKTCGCQSKTVTHALMDDFECWQLKNIRQQDSE